MSRDELREALVDALAMSPMSDFVGTDLEPLTRTADALLDGPVGELLAENERLVASLVAERDQALATLKAVRELAGSYAKDDADSLNLYGQHHPVAYHPARELSRILDGADGGGE